MSRLSALQPDAPPDDPRQVAYVAERAAWRVGFMAWLAAGRPAGFIVGGQRDGCREPGACRSEGPDLCRQCAAALAQADAA